MCNPELEYPQLQHQPSSEHARFACQDERNRDRLAQWLVKRYGRADE